MINYTKTASFELAPFGIRVNAIAPDIADTEGLRALSGTGDVPASAAAAVPMGRIGRADDIAAAAVFLASDMAGYVTGQTLHVDGGTEAAGGWYHHRSGTPRFGPG